MSEPIRVGDKFNERISRLVIIGKSGSGSAWPGPPADAAERGKGEMYVYIESEPHVWTVGFYKHDEEWVSESDHFTKEDAAKRVHYLNGGAAREEAPKS